jgi:probable rRNA maturation factor
MKIDLIDPPVGVDSPKIIKCAQGVLSGESKEFEYLNIIFLGHDELRLMKKEYFEKDVYTDVIAFNLNEPDENIEGEIYLSFEQIIENAAVFSTQPQEELLRVVIHGCLHLCGYEDDTSSQKDQMTVLENQYIKQFKGLST